MLILQDSLTIFQFLASERFRNVAMIQRVIESRWNFTFQFLTTLKAQKQNSVAFVVTLTSSFIKYRSSLYFHKCITHYVTYNELKSFFKV